ncbi:MAG: peptide deformylase [Gemmatimonadota bacterium]|jgi:peptide deformylase|nr:peptide deformylase [Gemmatimonadota bacterium]
MSLLPIRMLGDKVLRRPADEVEEVDDEVRRLIDDMFETMREAEGIGLAAPQVGLSRRVIVVDVHDEATPPFALINPRIVESTPATERAEEGCLSMPGLQAVVERPSHVTVEGLDRHGSPCVVSGGELLGRCLQHEIDHLDGVLFIDRIGPLKRNMLIRKWRKNE